MKNYEVTTQNGIAVDKTGIANRHKYSSRPSSGGKDDLDNGNGIYDKETYQPTQTFLQRNSQTIAKVRNSVLVLLYLGYYCYAMYCNYWDEPAIRLTVFTGFGILLIGWNKALTVESFKKLLKSVSSVIHKTYKSGRTPTVIRWSLYVIWTGLLVAYLIINVALKEPSKLRSLGGFVAFILLLFVISNNKRKINWHCVFWGTAVQCMLGVFIVKSEIGRTVILWFSDRLGEFMSYSRVASEFAFGKSYIDHPFAMQALPSIMVFCAVVQVLVYLGTIQFVVRTLGTGIAAILEVSAPEATNACANIFLGGIEAALLVIEYIDKLPTSRLFTLMTNWFASCGGSALIQFISFGVPASYLLAASAMSAPAALVCAKLVYPDEDQEEFKNAVSEVALEVVTDEDKQVVQTSTVSMKDLKTQCDSKEEQPGDTHKHSDKPKEKDLTNNTAEDTQIEDMMKKSELRRRMPDEPNSIGDALVLGTKRGLKLVANILANIIVSLSVIELLDRTVEWFGDRIDIHISLKKILSYVFYPFVYLMGVDEDDCLRAGQMLGIRTISAAGISYIDLGKLIDNRKVLLKYTTTVNETLTYARDSDIFLPQWNQTLVGGIFSERSEVIVAYALCGFASFPMIGMLIGGLSVLIPDRGPEITRLALKTLVTGTIASYLTACVAGLVA